MNKKEEKDEEKKELFDRDFLEKVKERIKETDDENGIKSESLSDKLKIDDYKVFHELINIILLKYNYPYEVILHIDKLKGFTAREKIVIAFKYSEITNNPGFQLFMGKIMDGLKGELEKIKDDKQDKEVKGGYKKLDESKRRKRSDN